MNSDKYNVTVENGCLVFPDESIPLETIEEITVDHRAFTCTAALLVFVAGCFACLYFAPELIILVAGCVFVWLKVEYSRYIELKIRFRDGRVKRMLSCSFTDRDSLYSLYDRLKKLVPPQS